MRRRAHAVFMWGLVFALSAQVPLLAAGPSDVLLFSRFKTDKKHNTTARITNTTATTTVSVIFVCAGSGQGFCPSLVTEFVLGRNATEVLNVDALNPPCGEGFFVAVATNARTGLIGSYEIARGRAGKRRISDSALPLGSEGENGTSGLTHGLIGDFRTKFAKDDSFLTLIDLNVVAAITGEDPLPSQSVQITGVSEDGQASSAEPYVFTCYARTAINRLSGRFTRGALGDLGTLVIRPDARGDALPPAVYGAISEQGPGARAKRTLFGFTEVIPEETP